MAFKITKKPAKATKRTTTKRSTKPKATKAAPRAHDAAATGRYDHVPIMDLDVVLLQMKDSGRVNVQDVVFTVFESEAKRWRGGAAWLAFYQSDVAHHSGLSTWIGLSKSVPLPVIDLLQQVLQAANGEVEREMGRALHLQMNPFARLSDDGLELLVPAALVGDPNARRVIERGGIHTIARGYTIQPDKADGLRRLFLDAQDSGPSKDRAQIKRRLRDRVEPQVGIRIIPKDAFEGRLGSSDRLYVCVGDYDELRGERVGNAVEILHGGRRRDEAHIKEVYGQWVNLQLGAPVDANHDQNAPSDYYVLKLDLRAGNDLDLFPGTWKAMSFILTDGERMSAARSVHERFMQIVGRNRFGNAAKEDVDSHELGHSIGEDEVGTDNAQHEFYQYLATDSSFANTLVGLFGIDNRCWHGKGYVGANGYVACRVFLARNVTLSHRSLISCELKGPGDVLE